MTSGQPDSNSKADVIEQDLYAHWSRNITSVAVAIEKPEGLLGDIADAILASSTRPLATISLTASIALMAGICGRAYGVSETGLNQYIFIVGKTGIGKDAIPRGIELAFEQVANNPNNKVPAIIDFMGAGDFTSYAGGYQALCGPSQSIVCVFGEYGKKLAEMATGKNPHLIGVSRLLLQAYSKSGKGQVLRPISYADKDRKTPSVHRPALTFVAEMTPAIYDLLDEGMIAEGTLPRALWVSVPDDRPARNRNPVKTFPGPTIEGLSNLAAICLTNASQQHPPIDVGFNPHDASGFILDCFDQWCDNEIRASGSGAVRELWNRAHLKALKLAALQAVGVNPHFPQITERWARWAIDFVHNQTVRLVAKFENGDVGEEAGNEVKQRKIVLELMAEFVCHKGAAHKDEHVRKMAERHVIPLSYLQHRVSQREAFYKDSQKASGALKRIIATMTANDELAELDAAYLKSQFGRAPKAYCLMTPFTSEFEELINCYIQKMT